MFPLEKKILARAYLSVRPSVFHRWVVFFFICDRISNEKWSYRWLLYRRMYSVGEAIGNFFTSGTIPSVKLFNGLVKWFYISYLRWDMYPSLCIVLVYDFPTLPCVLSVSKAWYLWRWFLYLTLIPSDEPLSLRTWHKHWGDEPTTLASWV
jgi:hypothetical protein